MNETEERSKADRCLCLKIHQLGSIRSHERKMRCFIADRINNVINMEAKFLRKMDRQPLALQAFTWPTTLHVAVTSLPKGCSL